MNAERHAKRWRCDELCLLQVGLLLESCSMAATALRPINHDQGMLGPPPPLLHTFAVCDDPRREGRVFSLNDQGPMRCAYANRITFLIVFLSIYVCPINIKLSIPVNCRVRHNLVCTFIAMTFSTGTLANSRYATCSCLFA